MAAIRNDISDDSYDEADHVVPTAAARQGTVEYKAPHLTPLNTIHGPPSGKQTWSNGTAVHVINRGCP
jgi:hypothetical protein